VGRSRRTPLVAVVTDFPRCAAYIFWPRFATSYSTWDDTQRARASFTDSFKTPAPMVVVAGASFGVWPHFDGPFGIGCGRTENGTQARSPLQQPHALTMITVTLRSGFDIGQLRLKRVSTPHATHPHAAISCCPRRRGPTRFRTSARPLAGNELLFD